MQQKNVYFLCLLKTILKSNLNKSFEKVIKCNTKENKTSNDLWIKPKIQTILDEVSLENSLL
jgi:hypothetical protein